MKICLFIDKLRNGGAERVTTILANYFAECSHDVYLFAIQTEKIEYRIDKSVHIVQIPTGGNKLGQIFKRLNFIQKKLKEIRANACLSLTYTFPMYILLTPKKYRGKMICSLRNAPQFDMTSVFGRLLRWFMFSMSDFVVFQTDDAKSYFTKNIQHRGVVIPNPLSDNIAHASANQTKKVVMVARLEEQKNIPMALKAFERFLEKYSDWRMHIYGRGGLQQKLKTTVDNSPVLQGRVIFEGFATNVQEQIKDAGMFISSSDFEGLSNSMIEAMAMGLPVICTDCPIGGAKMVIQPGVNGLLVPVGNAEKLAEAMMEVASDEVFAAELGKNAIKISKDLAVDVIAEKWLRLLNRERR